jgi:hypothetical protein
MVPFGDTRTSCIEADKTTGDKKLSVAVGPKSEVSSPERHVRSTLNDRRHRIAPARPVRAISGHSELWPMAVPLPRGKVMMNSVNAPASVSTSILPPCCLTMMS